MNKPTETAKTELKKHTYYYAVGRRRTSVARLRLYILANEEDLVIDGQTYAKGQIVVNGRPVEKYFPGEVMQKLYNEPLRTTNALGRFVITAKISGGGLFGQLNAFVHGLSRALVKIDPEKHKPILKKKGFMTRDPRAKQRRKAGFAGKARKKKQSPKR